MTTPRRLAQALKKNGGAIRATARTLQVNQYYVSRWLKHGEEPNNAEVRKRMGFKPLRKKHDGRSGFTELPAHVQWWRKLPKGERDQWIQRAHSADQSVQTIQTTAQ